MFNSTFCVDPVVRPSLLGVPFYPIAPIFGSVKCRPYALRHKNPVHYPASLSEHALTVPADGADLDHGCPLSSQGLDNGLHISACDHRRFTQAALYSSVCFYSFRVASERASCV